MATIHYKRIGLMIAVIVASALNWVAAKPWLESPLRFASWTMVLWPALTTVLLAAVVSIAWLLLERRMDRIAATLAAWASFVVFWTPDIWYLSALPLFLFFWLEASRRIRNDLADRRKLRITTSVGQGMKFILLGSFLMVSLGFYLLPSNRSIDTADVTQGVQRSIEDSYGSPIVEAQLRQLPAAMQSQVKRDIAGYADDMVERWLGPLGPFLPPLLAFGLFLVLWSVAFVFREVAIWTGALLFSILTATGFVRIGTEQVPRETISL